MISSVDGVAPAQKIGRNMPQWLSGTLWAGPFAGCSQAAAGSDVGGAWGAHIPQPSRLPFAGHLLCSPLLCPPLLF